jgi:hypothetical protein
MHFLVFVMDSKQLVIYSFHLHLNLIGQVYKFYNIKRYTFFCSFKLKVINDSILCIRDKKLVLHLVS